MPIPFIFHVLENGAPPWLIDNGWLIVKTLASITVIVLLRIWVRGAQNTAERDMHGRVVLITGGTSGIGAQTTRELAKRGAQIVLLTQSPPSDPFLVEFVQDLRNETNNDLIYAEQVDLASLHSIRKFATKWIDNAPPRRLDMIILCAATLTPPGSKRRETSEGIEETWMVNYLANFHLLGILSPAIRAQPFDREVRIVCATCSSYIGAPPPKDMQSVLDGDKWSPGRTYALSKFALMAFLEAFQKHLDAYKRPDQLPMNARVIFVNPGLSRTPGMRRWLTRGSLWGLGLYLASYFLPWLLLKSPEEGSQSLLYAAMESSLGLPGTGSCRLVKECMLVDFARKDVKDEEVAKRIWEESDKLIERVEKEQAVIRARRKKEDERKAKEKEEAEKRQEIEALVETIQRGKEQEAKKAKPRKKSKKI